MNKLNVCGVRALLLLTCFVFWSTSCINEEYDMSGDNLNLEVTPFQEGLILPLGSTDSIMLVDLLKGVSIDILDTTNNYSLKLADTLDLSENLPSLEEMLNIADIRLDRSLDFELEDIDVSGVAFKLDQPIEVKYPMPNFTVPKMPTIEIDEPFNINAGLPSPGNIEIDFRSDPISHEILKFTQTERDAIVTLLSLAGKTPDDTKIPLTQYAPALNLTFKKQTVTLPEMKLYLPKGTKVKDLILDPNAELELSVSLKQAILLEGEITPKIKIYLNDIFVLEDNSTGTVDLGANLELNKDNSYEAVYPIPVSDIKIDLKYDAVNDQYYFAKAFQISVEGTIEDNNLQTTTNLLTADANTGIGLSVNMNFKNFNIDVIADIGTIPVAPEQPFEVELQLDPIKMPEQIEKINYVSFNEESGITLEIEAVNLSNMDGLNAVLNNLDITFPKWLEVEGADEQNTITVISEHNLREVPEIKKNIKITKITNLPQPDEEGYIVFDASKIVVNTRATASGSINTADLPSNASEDVQIKVKVKSNLTIDDYEVLINDFPVEMTPFEKEINADIPPTVAELGTITVYPEKVEGENGQLRDPALSLNLHLPDLGSLELTPAAGTGLKLHFPEMLVFGEIPEYYHLDRSTNTIHLTEDHAIPDEIVLPISRLEITPVPNPKDPTKYIAGGSVKIEGGVMLKGGLIHQADVEAIATPNQEVSAVADMDRLAPSTVSFKSFQTNIKESISMDILEAGDLPEELVGVGRIELAGTNLAFDLGAGSLPDMAGTKLNLGVDITLPEFVKIKGQTGNVLNLQGSLDSEREFNWTVNGAEEVLDSVLLEIEALDMTGIDLAQGISGNIDVDVNVVLQDASLDIDKWLNQELKVDIKGGVNDISISKVNAKIGYQIDEDDMKPEPVDLSGIKKSLDDMGMEAKLSFNHAHIALIVDTNLDVPINANLNITPYDGEVARQPLVVDLAIHTSGEGGPMQLWLADNAGHDPDEINNLKTPDGYTLKHVDGLLDIFAELPDKLEISISGGTDADEYCSLDLSEELKLNIIYAFELPLEFGQDFKVSYKTAFDGLPEIVGEVLASGLKVGLLGDIKNALPFMLNMKLDFLDKDGNIIEMIDNAGEQIINACKYDFISEKVSASENPLDILVAVKEPEKARDITSLQISFDASSGDAVGVPITKDAYLQAVLRISLPDGVTVDLKELMNSSKEQ